MSDPESLVANATPENRTHNRRGELFYDRQEILEIMTRLDASTR